MLKGLRRCHGRLLCLLMNTTGQALQAAPKPAKPSLMTTGYIRGKGRESGEINVDYISQNIWGASEMHKY